VWMELIYRQKTVKCIKYKEKSEIKKANPRARFHIVELAFLQRIKCQLPFMNRSFITLALESLLAIAILNHISSVHFFLSYFLKKSISIIESFQIFSIYPIIPATINEFCVGTKT
jgi:hypothetical protein